MALVTVADPLSVLMICQYGAPLLPAMTALLATRQALLCADEPLVRLAPSFDYFAGRESQPVRNAHVYPDSGFASGQCRQVNRVCQVDEEPAPVQRYGQRLRSAFGQRQSLAKPYLGQSFDTDDVVVAAGLEHTGVHIGKLDGVPAPAGLEARVARCLSLAHPPEESLSRPVSAAQNAASNLNRDPAPEVVVSTYRREFPILAVQRHTHASPVRPAPLFERGIV